MKHVLALILLVGAVAIVQADSDDSPWRERGCKVSWISIRVLFSLSPQYWMDFFPCHVAVNPFMKSCGGRYGFQVNRDGDYNVLSKEQSSKTFKCKAPKES